MTKETKLQPYLEIWQYGLDQEVMVSPDIQKYKYYV